MGLEGQSQQQGGLAEAIHDMRLKAVSFGKEGGGLEHILYPKASSLDDSGKN